MEKTGLSIEKIQRAPNKKELNSEWFELKNASETPFNTEGCSLAVSRGGKGRPRTMTTLKAGVVVKPGETVRVVSGSPGRASQGAPPEETAECRNVHLFLKGQLLEKPGTTLHLLNKQQVELCRARG
jgi:hypothetical protein